MILKFPQERGAALVVAMLILALVAVFAVSMSVEYNFSVQRVGNQMLAQQAYSYLRGTEALAHKVLEADLIQDRDAGVTVDNLGEFWAKEVPPFMLEEGSYTARLFDLQGRFNLNSLRNTALAFPPTVTPPNVPYTITQGIFMRLLLAVGDDHYSIDYAKAQAITEAVVDWLDADQNTSGFDGCEDNAYAGIDGRQPHRTADMPMMSVSELRLICNLPVELYERLLPHITVWPLSGQGGININTATPAVLRSIIVPVNALPSLQAVNNKTSYQPPEPVAEADLETLLAKQSMQGYEQIAEVNNDLQGNQLWPAAPIVLYSDYFLLESEATLGDLTQSMSSVISREGGKIVVVARSTGGL